MTRYDGQATWDPHLFPSSALGVTTVLHEPNPPKLKPKPPPPYEPPPANSTRAASPCET